MNEGRLKTEFWDGLSFFIVLFAQKAFQLLNVVGIDNINIPVFEKLPYFGIVRCIPENVLEA